MNGTTIDKIQKLINAHGSLKYVEPECIQPIRGSEAKCKLHTKVLSVTQEMKITLDTMSKNLHDILDKKNLRIVNYKIQSIMHAPQQLQQINNYTTADQLLNIIHKETINGQRLATLSPVMWQHINKKYKELNKKIEKSNKKKMSSKVMQLSLYQ